MTIFTAPSWIPDIPYPPDHIPISEFMINQDYGRLPLDKSNPPYVCGYTGKSYSWSQVRERMTLLSRALKRELGVTDINKGGEENGFSQWEKVVAFFSINVIDYPVATWAVQNLNGIASPANATYTPSELAFQLKDSKARLLITSPPNLEVALEAAKDAGIPREKIFLFDVPDVVLTDDLRKLAKGFKTLDQLIQEGSRLEEVERLQWKKGTGAKKIAYLCYSSGTSGLPKGCFIAHRNVIANVLQVSAACSTYRDLKKAGTCLGLLPMSHIYSLVVICHFEPFNGSSAIVLPKFDLIQVLESTQRFQIAVQYLVPPILIALIKNQNVVEKYDFKCVKNIFVGAAPLTQEMSQEAARMFPHLQLTQGYGMTECSTVAAMTSGRDIWHGSSGCVVPGTECRIVSAEGKILGEGETGELQIKGPSVTLGYNRPQATKETFIEGGWLRSGDEAVMKKSPNGNIHLFIVDRLKDLIKVKGMQVAPAELEGQVLDHPKVNDCAVIPVPDERAGELPKAYVVLKDGVKPTDELKEDIMAFVAKHKSRHKHLKGGIEFTDAIPKNPSGKILRRLLRDADRKKRQKEGPKL